MLFRNSYASAPTILVLRFMSNIRYTSAREKTIIIIAKLQGVKIDKILLKKNRPFPLLLHKLASKLADNPELTL